MPEHDWERKAMNAMNDIYRKMEIDIAKAHAGEGDPDKHTVYLEVKGSYRRFDLDDGQYLYRYFRTDDQWEFAYTPWKDSEDWYWSWVVKPVGPGSRSGKATTFKRYKMQKHRKRKDAKARAIRMYENRQDS